MRAESTFIPHRWACCDVNQVDDESLGWMILLAAVNSSPQSAESGIEWDVSIVHKSSMMPVTCSKYKWEMLEWAVTHASFLHPMTAKKHDYNNSNLNDSDKSNRILF